MVRRKFSDDFGIANDPEEFVTLLMDEKLALGAFEALTPEAPNAVVAISAKRFSIEALRLEDVAVHFVEFPPSSGASSINGAIFALTRHPGGGGPTLKHKLST